YRRSDAATREACGQAPVGRRRVRTGTKSTAGALPRRNGSGTFLGLLCACPFPALCHRVEIERPGCSPRGQRLVLVCIETYAKLFGPVVSGRFMEKIVAHGVIQVYIRVD